MICDRSKRYEEAIHYFNQALSIDPRNSVYLHNRGFCHRNTGNYTKAVSDFTACLGVDPSHFQAYTNRGYR